MVKCTNKQMVLVWGGSLGPVLANIIMTECEKVIVNQLIENNIVKFYIRYVDDTLLVLRNKDTDIVLNKFNSLKQKFKIYSRYF